VGRNGAGKSTLFKSVMNAGPRVAGSVRWEGRELAGLASHQRARLGLALVPEDRRIFGHVTVLENIAMAHHAAPRGVALEAPEAVVQRFDLLVPVKDRLGSQLSGGQQQMVAVARAVAARPRLMLLDEPTEGLAPVITQKLARDVLNVCRESGAALLLSEQNLWFARQCTDTVYILDTGRFVFRGNWAELDAQPGLKQRYLAV
jgi:ABC-type branched-subunit amino acid transport system ATPase component